MPTIEVTPEIVIDQSELAFSFARAGGPGGIRGVAVVHRELRGRGRYRSDDNRDCDEDAHGHCLLK